MNESATMRNCCKNRRSAVSFMWLLVLAFASTTNFVTGQTTTSPTNSPSTWSSKALPFEATASATGKTVATSSNGQYVAIANQYGIYASTDYGNTFAWSNAPTLQDWSTIVADPTGQTMYAIFGGAEVYYTANNDLLNGWQVFQYSSGYALADIAVSSGSSYVYAVSNNAYSTCVAGVATATSSFYFIASPSLLFCNQISTDTTGAFVAILGSTASGVNQVAISNNYGASFTIYSTYYTGSGNGLSVMATSYANSNKYLFIPYSGQSIEVSSNGGSSFTLTTTSTNNDATNSIACSGSGQMVLFGGVPSASSSQLWLSTNYGASFSPVFNIGTNTVTGVTMSSAGTSMYAVAQGSFYSYQQGEQ